MYAWRSMSDSERLEALAARMLRGGSWRRPPVWQHGPDRFLLTAACYEHAPIIGGSPRRMDEFEEALLVLLREHCASVFAHAVLFNHYHALIHCEDIRALRADIGRFHGRTSRQWNLEDGTKERQIFHGAAETRMKSEGHFHATVNYVHHNPVKHGYVKRWQDWPWSSAVDYLQAVGEEEAARRWRAYPVDRYGEGWDRD
jgi:putative transposase